MKIFYIKYIVFMIYPAFSEKDNLFSMKEKYKCSKCGDLKERWFFHEKPHSNNRPVSYYCKECRRDRDRTFDHFKRQFKKHKRLCSECQQPRKLAYLRKCGKCLKNNGLRVCKKCGELLLIELNFYKNKGVCKHCYGKE